MNLWYATVLKLYKLVLFFKIEELYINSWCNFYSLKLRISFFFEFFKDPSDVFWIPLDHFFKTLITVYIFTLQRISTFLMIHIQISFFLITCNLASWFVFTSRMAPDILSSGSSSPAISPQIIDVHNPLYVHPLDIPNLHLIPHELRVSENYGIRSKAMKLALSCKGKMCLINGKDKGNW